MPLRLVGICCGLLIVGALASGAGAANQTVSALASNDFSPAEVTVTQGEQVTFTNSGGEHNVHFDDGSVDNPASASSSGWSFSHTFNDVGDVRYYCERHGGPGGSGMSGIVHVVAAPSGPPPGGGPPVPEPGGGGSPGPGPGGPAPGGQPPRDRSGGALKVTLKTSDATPLAGRAVRLFGVVKPARDGRKLQIQRRLRNGKFKTIATTRLHAASGDKSTYGLKLRLDKDATLRARVGSGFSAARKLDVHRAA